MLAVTKVQVLNLAVKMLFLRYPTNLVDKQFKFQIQFVKFPLMDTGFVERVLVFFVRDIVKQFKDYLNRQSFLTWYRRIRGAILIINYLLLIIDYCCRQLASR